MSSRHHLRINDVSVVISSEPIEGIARAGGLDALVSSDDTRLSMGGGVSAAIRIAGGELIAQEARKLAPVRVGDVAVTSAGSLPAKYVLHAVTVDWDQPVRPSESTIRLAAENVLRRCELLRVRRVAMPAIGIGAAQLSADHSARQIVSALAKHSASPTTIEEFVFSLPEKDAHGAFLQFLQRVALRPTDDLSSETGQLALADGTHPATTAGSLRANKPGARGSGRPTGALPTATRTKTAHTSTDFLRWLFRRERRSAEHRLQERDARHPTSIQESRPLVGNRYVLLEELGRGGMSIVYLAWDIVLRKTVAIKTLRPGERMAQSRIEGLRQEAALQIGLVHHGIVRLFNFEPWDETVGPYIIMEYVPWMSGDRWIAEAGLSRLPLRAVLSVGICLCDALAHAHNANVMHGDIKPSNVFVDPAGRAAKLADFGIARAVGGTERSALVTRLIGTPRYMAPEQKTVGALVGPRTDLYLLSRTLADFIGATVDNDGAVGLPDDATVAPAAAVLKRGLANEADHRPMDATEFGSLLQGALAATV
jgi:O-acetyl-ADP-ribose deacetylase (regulator of RNase III)